MDEPGPGAEVWGGGRREAAGDEDGGDRLGSRPARATSAPGKGSLVRRGREDGGKAGPSGLNCQAGLDAIGEAGSEGTGNREP